MTVDLFIPCFIDQFHPEVALATVKVLRRAGVEVEYNPNQTCCGRFAYNAGFIEDAKALGDKFMSDFSNNRPIVAPTASCVNFITEISNYTWDHDKFGTKLNVPIDDFNHLLDAMRYALEKYIVGSKWIT